MLNPNLFAVGVAPGFSGVSPLCTLIRKFYVYGYEAAPNTEKGFSYGRLITG